MTHTHCRGCGRKLPYVIDEDDGLCSAGYRLGCCYSKFVAWSGWTGKNYGPSLRSPERAVKIDEWLEKGCP